MNLPSKKSLDAALLEIYQQRCDNQAMITLLRFLAEQLRQLHHQGTLITPLNNHTIFLLTNNQLEWQTLEFAPECEQLNTYQPLTEKQCAENLAAIDLPDDYWRIFKHMYFNDSSIPENFEKIIEAQRAKLRFDTSFSKQNIWLWDEKSAQAMIVLHSRSKKHFRKKRDAVKLIFRVLTTLPQLFFTYKRLLRQAYQKPVCLQSRISVALHPDYWPQEQALLSELGKIPVLLRFYAHETEKKWQQSIIQIRQLREAGHAIAIALVQDRKSVLDIKHWQRLLDYVVPAIHGQVEWIEVGHATNRVKWGIWTTAEYVQLTRCVTEYIKRYPKLRLVGPAVIDFEWYRLIDLLKALPRTIKFFAVSQHLYVDRRGAPENFQGKFSTLEKCAMGKAIAKTSRHSEDRFIISEFNWPLKNTGIYSPIGSPYTAPAWFRDSPGVTEQEYAEYLIRYLAIALCSGFVDQAVVWRLSAHGYGLVDELDDFRKRPAFYALKTFIKIVGNAQFVKRWPSSNENYLLEFNQNEQRILLVWTTAESTTINIEDECQWAVDIVDKAVTIENNRILLSTAPHYYFLT